MSSQPFVGEIAVFAFNFVPSGWASCSGQLLPISQNTALFSILGTSYGGNGMTTFALPDLNGRAALGAGQGPGLSPYELGEQGGQATVTLLPLEMPPHVHSMRAAPGAATTHNPALAVPATSEVELYGPAPSAQQALAVAGGDQPHNNMQPSLTVHYCIALQGIYPSRP